MDFVIACTGGAINLAFQRVAKFIWDNRVGVIRIDVESIRSINGVPVSGGTDGVNQGEALSQNVADFGQRSFESDGAGIINDEVGGLF